LLSFVFFPVPWSPAVFATQEFTREKEAFVHQISELQEQIEAYSAEVTRLTSSLENSVSDADSLKVKISQVHP
jgi:hypothetical protein